MKSSTPIITDEMLAAYLAGNTTAHETALILRAVETDPSIRESLRILSETEIEEAADTNILPMMAMAAKNEVDNLCAIRCVGYALRALGVDVTDEQLQDDAEGSGSLLEQGMPFGMLGEFIRPYGLDAQYQSNCSIDLLRQNLSQENVVIALVDGGELTGDVVREKQEDVIMGARPDHVVVIESIEENRITIRDSYTPEQLDTYPLSVFLDAWEDSQRNMIVIKKNRDA